MTSADTFTPFLLGSVSKARLYWGTLVLLPAILGYKLGLVSSSRIRRLMVRVCFTGVPVSQLKSLGQHHQENFLSKTIRPKALERIHWHQEQGDRIIIVSASLDAYLKPWCQEMGLELICSELESENEVLTGRYLCGDCTGSNKVSLVHRYLEISNYSKVYAYGDTEEDNELLELADEKYFCWQKLND